MKTCLIAVGYGEMNDPFTCSAISDNPNLDINDGKACRAEIARLQKLDIDIIDEVLVVQDSEVIEQHGGQDGF